jgi:hypothetical protein
LRPTLRPRAEFAGGADSLSNQAVDLRLLEEDGGVEADEQALVMRDDW